MSHYDFICTHIRLMMKSLIENENVWRKEGRKISEWENGNEQRHENDGK